MDTDNRTASDRHEMADGSDTSTFDDMSPHESNRYGSGSGSPVDAIPRAFTQMVDQAIQSLQPKIHDAVSGLAERAVRLSNQAARDVAAKVRDNPWYMVGGAVLLFVGLGLAFGLEERRDRRLTARARI